VLVLPSGSIIGLSLAAGIAAALTLARLRARVRRTPGTPLPDNGGHGPGDRDTTRRLLGFAAKAGAPDDLDRDANPAHPTPPVAHAPLPAPDPRCPHPGRVVVAERDGKELALDLAGCGAIAITGPAAAGAARAAVVAFLAAGGPAATEVLLIGEELLPGVAEFPGLRRAGDLASGLTALDTELLHRARLLDLEDAPDYTTHRREHPDDPLPALVLAVDAVPPDQAARLLGALIQGPRLGVGALLTNTTPEGAARVTLDGTGRIDAAVPTTLTDQQLTGARMLTLTEPEAAELLDILASSRTDLPLAPDQPAEPTPAAAPPQPPEPAHGARAAAAMLPSDAAPTPAAEPATPLAAAGDATALLRVQLLGAYRIQTAGGEVRTGLRARARELLAYYLLHPNGVSLAAAVEALWPEAAPGQGIDWAWTALGNLRATLRKATGVAELKLIERHGEVYRPNRALLDVDLWRVEAALATAQQAVDAPAVTAALADAVAAYLGALLDGIDYYTWLEIPREDLRRRIVDAAARLAELRDAAGQADGALAALEQAVTFDPYAEELYRRIMRLQAIQGRPDAVRRTYQQLQRHLAELDVEPDQMTEALLTELLERRPPRRGHRSR
jgi:DNA-binding SARP family transcriptional activator